MGEHNHPEISMHTFPLGDYMVHIKTGDWKKVADLMLSSTKKVAGMGADFAICPDNTIHEAFDFVIRKSPIPWLHIAEEVAKKATDTGYKKIAITGTKYLMEGPVYPETLKKFDIDFEIPDKGSREKIDTIIFKELVNGIFSEKSRRYFNEVIDKLKQAGCDAVVLGCTEIPLLVKPDDCPLPTLDSTRLLARAALREAVG